MSAQDIQTANIAMETKPGHQGHGPIGIFVADYGVLLLMAATYIVFCGLRPGSFLTFFVMKSILRDCVPLMVAALGITFVFVMNDYDLSIGGLTALMATTAVLFVSDSYVGLGTVLGVALTIMIGGLIAFTSGLLIAYGGLPSFILTIALGTVFTGIGLQLTNSRSLYEGLPDSYAAIASGTVFGMSNQIFIGVSVLAVCHLLLRHTEPGRYMYAIGGNPEAARLSGVPVKLLKATGFGLVGIAASISAVLLTSQANAANPNTGLGILLPAYAAAFLGSSVFRSGLFTALGTGLAALYLQVIGTGLTILSLSGPLVQMIQGAILIGAIALAVLNRKRMK